MNLNLPRAFGLTPYLMVICGHLCLIMTSEIPLYHELIMLACVPAAAFYERSKFRLPILFWNALLIAILVACLSLVYFSIRDFEAVFHGVLYFLVYVLMVRLFNKESDRDYVLIYILSFMELCAASILTIHLRFLLALILYLVVATWTLIVFNLKREVDRASSTGDDELDPMLRARYYRIISPRLLLTSTFASLIIFVLCIAMFFMTPRLGRGFFQWKSGMAPRVSGFSDTVELGQLASIKIDNTPVMRIHLLGQDEPIPHIKWRGNALDYFDGKRWTDTMGIKTRLRFSFDERNPLGFPGQFGTMVSVGSNAPLKGLLKQEVYLDPIESPVLFAAGEVEYFQVPAMFRGLLIYSNDYFALPLDTPIYDRIKYMAHSNMPENDPQDIRAAWDRADRKIVKKLMVEYLFLPSDMDRVAGLARQVVRDQENPYDQALLIQRYLETNYSYSLTRSRMQEKTPLEDFLFRDKRGHCEYYATALAVMLRTLGVPTRLVGGFQRGIWNPYEKYYRVRQSDAHSWVEVYCPEFGWVEFDPTPAASITYNEQFGLLSRLQELLDSMRFRWNRYVVDLKLEDQLNAAKNLQDRGADVGRRLSNLPMNVREQIRLGGHSPAVLVGVMLIGASLLVILVHLLWVRGLSGFRRKDKAMQELNPDQQKALVYLLRMLKVIGRHGLIRNRAQTVDELISEVSEKNTLPLKPIKEVAGIYHDIRFGFVAFGADEKKRLERALGELEKIKPYRERTS